MATSSRQPSARGQSLLSQTWGRRARKSRARREGRRTRRRGGAEARALLREFALGPFGDWSNVDQSQILTSLKKRVVVKPREVASLDESSSAQVALGPSPLCAEGLAAAEQHCRRLRTQRSVTEAQGTPSYTSICWGDAAALACDGRANARNVLCGRVDAGG